MSIAPETDKSEQDGRPYVPVERLLDIAALTDEGENPPHAVQWSVVDRDGQRHIFGDQTWVRDGRVLDEFPGGRIEHRHLTITYTRWSGHGGGS